jgi:undecaprenyl diphosphate synthase
VGRDKASGEVIIPSHVAIIMDGNGRWARQRHLPRIMGHYAGVKAVEKTVMAALEMGIRYLSLFAFSTENWTRPKGEVLGLFGLFRYYIKCKVKKLVEENIRLRFSGRIDKLPEDLRDLAFWAEKETEAGDKLDLILCLNYGGRQEIIDAVNKILAAKTDCDDVSEIDEYYFRGYLYLPDVPDPDLIIRTSGEKRLSNFWLWQSSYSELYFTDCLWPEFDEGKLREAVEEYQKRERRYGGIRS